eukprot:s902_g26.t1
MWGRSLRNGRSSASPKEATTIQIHATVEATAFHKLLTNSGYNKLFFTPKQQNGKPSNDFRILWTKGDWAHTIALSAQTTESLGVVRGKNSALGLRYTLAGFEQAWKTIHPQIAIPQQFQNEQAYKIENLPFGTSHQMLTEWAEASQWRCRPFRTLGPTTWIVKAADPPPDRIHMFNTTVLLIRLMPERDNQKNRLIVGPRGPPQSKTSDHHDTWTPMTDPWSKYRPSQAPSTSLPARSLEGPLEAKFSAQDEKIAALRTDLEALTKTHEEHTIAVRQEFEIAKQREQEEFQKVQYGMKQIQQELDANLMNTMKSHSQAMEQQFRDLKNLFISHKRKSDDGTNDAML